MAMYWTDPLPTARAALCAGAVDVAFRIACPVLPVDHAGALAEALCAAAPWLGSEPRAGVHPLGVAPSGNGWQAPEDPRGVVHLSRRTRLVLRVPRARTGAAEALAGRALDVAGHRLALHPPTVHELRPHSTLLARRLAFEQGESEAELLDRIAEGLRSLGIGARRLLCGRTAVVQVAHARVSACSLMVGGLEHAESLRLQERGLGRGRILGCGVFVGHKGVPDPAGAGV
jgi:CRISPR-associated protein Cas6